MKHERRAALGLATEFDQRHGLHRCCTHNCNQGRACVLKPPPPRRRDPQNLVERIMRMLGIF